MRRPLVLGLAAAAALAAAIWALRSRDGAPLPAATYVGGAACAGCHGAEAARWAGSHHDRAMEPATDASVLGDFGGATFTHRGVETTFYRDGDAFMVRTQGPDGALADYRVAFTFGAEPLQQYLIPFPDGSLQALGVAWDARRASQGGQRWFPLLPDADTGPAGPLHWTRPSQRWNTLCADCHSTGVDKGFDPESGTFATTWTSVDVSCEACHGPGSRHVRLATETADGGRAAEPDWALTVELGTEHAWSLEPGATTATRTGPTLAETEISTCAPCHSRRATLATAHRPGSDYLDAYAPSLLREGLYHADGQILDEVYVYGSFLQSRMLQAGVTCSDCHEPHGLELRAQGNALCTRCHAAGAFDVPEHTRHTASSEGARCVACHMPATTYMGVDDRRDHSLRVPRPDVTLELGVPNACDGCHTDRLPGWAANALGSPPPEPDPRGRYARAVHGGRRGDPAALAGLLAVAADAGEPPILRATALSLLGRYPVSRTMEALRSGLRDEAPLVRMGALQALGGVPADLVTTLASPLVDDSVGAVRAEAARVLALRAGTPTTAAETAALERALDEHERIQRVNADHAGAWVNLGDLYAARRRSTDAEAAYLEAIELDATDPAAYVNLSDLQRGLGRDDLAEETLGRALVIVPDAPELLHAMGLLEVRRGDMPGAIGWLARAAAGQPESARFAYVHAVALWSVGDTATALDALGAALRRHPFDADLLAALAAYSRDLERSEAGR